MTPDFETLDSLQRSLRARKVSSVELTQATLARADSLGPRYNCVVEVLPEQALAEARDADRRLATGHAGPLCGIPYGTKDAMATAGVPTRWGAPPYADQVFDYDAMVVRRLREAGAVLTVKLAMIELAGACLYGSASASASGPCLNPWDTSRWSGGSSSGSAAAVAAGIVPFALGTETGGSLVGPAAFCGVATLRPTWGAVSNYGVLSLGWSMDKVGPLARSAADCARVLQAIAGFDDLDPTTWTRHTPPAVGRRPLRLGALDLSAPMPTATRDCFHRALDVLRDLGHEVRPVDPPHEDYLGLSAALMAGEVLVEHEELIKSPRLDLLVDDIQKQRLTDAAQQSPGAYPRAMRERVRVSHAIRKLFRSADVLVAPTAFTEAPPLDIDLIEYRMTARGGHAAFGTIAGVPELSVPMGFGPAGLPLGLSFIGDLGSEMTLVKLGRAFQRSTGWHRQHPRLP